MPLSLVVRRWKMPGRRHSGPAIPRRDPVSVVGPQRAYALSSKGWRTGYPRPRLPLGSWPACELTPYQARGRWAAWTLGWPTQIPYLRGPQPDHWPPSCLRAFRGGVTAGLSPRKVRVYHRALGVAGLPCLGAAQHPPAKRGKADQPTSSIANHLPTNQTKTPQLNKSPACH